MFKNYKIAITFLLCFISMNAHAITSNNPTTVALSFIHKLYGPYKIKLQQKRLKLEKINNKLVIIENDIINQRISDKQVALTTLEHKKAKIQKILNDLTNIITAVDHCPANIKNEAIQKKLAIIGNRFLGSDHPTTIQTRAQELLTFIEYLEKRIV